MATTAITPNDYASWAQTTAGVAPPPAGRYDQIQQTVNSQGQTVYSVPDATTPESSVSSFNNVPLNQLINPAQANSAWNTADPMQKLYVGSQDTKTLGHHGIIGNLADKWKIRAKSGQNLEELVLAHAASLAGLGKGKGLNVTTTTHNPLLQTGVPGVDVPIISTQKVSSKFSTPSADVIASALHVNVAAGEDPVAAIARKFGVNTTALGQHSTTTLAQAETGIRQMYNTPEKINQLQSQLEAAGYFTQGQQPGSSGRYTPGNFDGATQMAVGSLLSDTAKANNVVGGQVKGKAVTWLDTIEEHIASVNAQGGIDEILKRNRAAIPQATESQLASPAMSAFQAELGRGATAGELSDLTSKFDTQQVNKYAGMAPGTYMSGDPTTGIQSAPGVATPTAAAAQYAQQNGGAEFFAHSMMNARSMLSDLISGNGNIAQTGAAEAVKPS